MNILVIAPHADDEIIGVGGTIIKHIQNKDNVYVCIVTKGTEPLFSNSLTKTIREESNTCHKMIGIKKTFFLDFPAVMLEKINRYELNGKIEEVISIVKPDMVYIPHVGDMQKDHQLVAEASMVGLRPKHKHKVSKIYAYETLSETGWNIPNIQNEFIPNVFVDITEQLPLKLKAMQCYKSQLADFPATRSLTAIEALSKYRGSLMNLNAAEAFSLVREVII